MPIINNFDGNETEITKIVNVVNGVEYDITDVYLADKHVFTVWGETEGALPRTFNANGDNAVEWQVYGETGGVGQRTGNLFDWSIVTNGKTIAYDGSIEDYQSRIATTTPIDVSAQNSVILSYSYVSGYNILAIIALYANGSMISRTTGNTSGTTIDTSQADEMLICFYDLSNTITKDKVVNSMLTEGSTAPAAYIPYGYEVPMAAGDGNTSNAVNLYIGSTPLDQGEYTSYKDQKIYKYFNGVLTPTDPPVSIPVLPTLDGVTVVDTELDSSAVQPEKAVIKYRKENS